MELLRNGLKLVAVQGLDDSEGSVNVPVKLVHNSDDQYVNFTEQLHIRYINDRKAFEEILPSKDSEFYIPGKVFVESGPIQLAVHLINGDVERVTNELQFVVKKAPNGKTLVDPSEFSWQQLVDQYVSAKLETFADKADMNEFKNGINANLTNQDKKITDLQTSTKFDLDSQSTKINDITSTQNSKIAILESRMSTFTSLKEGSTTGDAELIDARIGADGTTYPSAGDAMRGQIEQLKEDLADLNEEVGMYKPLCKKGTTVASGNVPIVENVSLKKGVTYTYSCGLDSAVDSATYIGLYEDSVSTSYLAVATINAGTTSKASRSFKWIYDDTENAYFTISSTGRTVVWNFELTDDADHSSRIDKLEDGITIFDDRLEHLEIPTYQKITEDISHTIKYTDKADDYADSQKISVVYGDKVKTYNPNTPYRQIKVYYGGSLVRTIDNVFEYTVVDTSVTHLILTVYKNQKDMDDTVIITRSKLAPKKEDKYDYAIRKPRVTFIDDDGNVEFYTHLLPIMKIQGVPMVSAYMGDSNTDMHSNSAMMNLEQCKAVIDAGGEIIVHYNPDLRTLSLDEAERIVLKSKNVLKKYGFNSDLVAYSNGTCSPEIRAMIAKHFKAGFTGAYPRVSNTDRSNHDCIPQYFIHREPCGGLYYDASETSRSYDYFKNMVDECVANNGWLVFTLHSWLMPEGQTKPEYGNTNQLELLGQIISYIKSLEATTGIKIVTASEGLEMFGNAMQTGDYMGHWNEMTLTAEESTMMGGHNASDAGCAMNKSGQWDFPMIKKITH